MCKRSIVLSMTIAFLIIVAFIILGCAGSATERREQFDAAISQAEAAKAAAKEEIDRRIADVRAVFDQQKVALEAHIEELTAQLELSRQTIAKLEAQAATQPEQAAAIAAEVARIRADDLKLEAAAKAAKSIEAKIEATYNATTGKFEKITAEIFREADARINALKVERSKITSENPGEQIQGVGNVIVGALPPGLPQLIGGLAVTSIAGIANSIYQARQKSGIRNAAIEAIGTMSTAIASGSVVMNKEARDKLIGAQSEAAKDIVDEAQLAYRDVLKLISPLKPAT